MSPPRLLWQPEDLPVVRLPADQRLARYHESSARLQDIVARHRSRWLRVYDIGADFNFVRDQEVHKDFDLPLKLLCQQRYGVSFNTALSFGRITRYLPKEWAL